MVMSNINLAYPKCRSLRGRGLRGTFNAVHWSDWNIDDLESEHGPEGTRVKPDSRGLGTKDPSLSILTKY